MKPCCKHVESKLPRIDTLPDLRYRRRELQIPWEKTFVRLNWWLLSSRWWGANEQGTRPLQSWSSGGSSSSRFHRCSDDFPAVCDEWLHFSARVTECQCELDQLRQTDGESRVTSVQLTESRSRNRQTGAVCVQRVWTEMKRVWGWSLYPRLSPCLPPSLPLLHPHLQRKWAWCLAACYSALNYRCMCVFVVLASKGSHILY